MAALRRPGGGAARRRQVRDRRQPRGQGPQQRRDPAVHLHRGARSTPTRSSRARRCGCEPGERLSFGTYFNAFPASYWRRWTIVDDVTLTVEVQGAGASVTSTSRWPTAAPSGSTAEIAEDDQASASPSSCRSSRSSTAAGTGTTSWPVTTTSSWRRPSGPPRCRPTAPSTARVDIAITTMNRPDYCRQAGRPARRDRGAAPLPRPGDGHGAGHPADARLASSSRPRRSRWATCCE